MRKGTKRALILTMVFLLVGSLLMGCGQVEKSTPSDQPSDQQPKDGEMATITLYYGDKDAMHLVSEVRDVVVSQRSIKEAIIEELIKGPEDADYNRTIPAETSLISINMENGIVTVDFTEQLVTKHWGGSTGELFTVYSVVNSLTELDEVEGVQFLVEGKKIETLSGHLDLEEIFTRDESFIKQ